MLTRVDRLAFKVASLQHNQRELSIIIGVYTSRRAACLASFEYTLLFHVCTWYIYISWKKQQWTTLN